MALQPWRQRSGAPGSKYQSVAAFNGIVATWHELAVTSHKCATFSNVLGVGVGSVDMIEDGGRKTAESVRSSGNYVWTNFRRDEIDRSLIRAGADCTPFPIGNSVQFVAAFREAGDHRVCAINPGIRQYSIWLDLLIGVKTFKTVLTGFGGRRIR